MRATFGRVIEEARKRRGFDRVPVARVAGVSPSRLAEIEKGGNPSLNLMLKLAHALEIQSVTVGPLRIRFATGTEGADLLGGIEGIQQSLDRLRDQVTAEAGLDGKSGSPVPLNSIQPLEATPGDLRPTRLPIMGMIVNGRMVPSDGTEELMLPADAGPRDGAEELRVTDDSLAYAGLAAGDRVIVDRGGELGDSRRIVAEVNGRVIVGHYRESNGERRIETGDPEHDVVIGETDQMRLIGVVYSIVRIEQ